MKKRYFALAFLLIILISLSSCGGAGRYLQEVRQESFENGYHEGYREGYDDALSDVPEIIGEMFRNDVADLEDQLEVEEGMTPEDAIKIATWYAEGEFEYVDQDELQQALWVLRYYFLGLEDLSYDISSYTID